MMLQVLTSCQLPHLHGHGLLGTVQLVNCCKFSCPCALFRAHWKSKRMCWLWSLEGQRWKLIPLQTSFIAEQHCLVHLLVYYIFISFPPSSLNSSLSLSRKLKLFCLLNYRGNLLSTQTKDFILISVNSQLSLKNVWQAFNLNMTALICFNSIVKAAETNAAFLKSSLLNVLLMVFFSLCQNRMY